MVEDSSLLVYSTHREGACTRRNVWFYPQREVSSKPLSQESTLTTQLHPILPWHLYQRLSWSPSPGWWCKSADLWASYLSSGWYGLCVGPSYLGACWWLAVSGTQSTRSIWRQRSPGSHEDWQVNMQIISSGVTTNVWISGWVPESQIIAPNAHGLQFSTRELNSHDFENWHKLRNVLSICCITFKKQPNKSLWAWNLQYI